MKRLNYGEIQLIHTILIASINHVVCYLKSFLYFILFNDLNNSIKYMSQFMDQITEIQRG